jgi:hypothetical protein
MQELETTLSLAELDISANQGNKSASGMDGLSNCFIKRYWEFLRVPLHRYSVFCHNKGTLTQNFSSASIKLIPKKGDASKIKNWRPISLLSCLYKVISRALNNRLKKVTGFIFSRAQKGFTSDRHIQEVLLNVTEMISHCKKYDIPGAILSIDQAKAFDCISHKYMRQVYRFFGLGPNFIKLLETLGNNRTACIAFEDGSHSKHFDLKCGRAQGNTSSPTEYNMGQQILIFKIELCPVIKSVYQNHFISRPYLPLAIEHLFEDPPLSDRNDNRFRNESGFETDKCDGFADDNTAGTLCEFESLNALKTILDQFASVSGLKCNSDKTVLMQVGRKVEIGENIRNLGFNISDSIHILGMTIDSELQSLDANFDKTLDGLKKSVEFWGRYYLTLPGRINIIKCLLLSQVTYLGSILMPSSAKLTAMQSILDNYALGKINFSKKKIPDPVEQCGLGLFNIENFLTAQQATWVLKSRISVRDNWRAKLRSLCNGNVLCLGPELISEDANPLLHGIAVSFEKVRMSHDNLHCNFTKALVINNKLFFRGPGDKRILDFTYLELDENRHNPITGLEAKDFFNVNGLKTRVELNVMYGVNLSINGYSRLATCLNHYVRRLRPRISNNGSARTLAEEFIALKKPGKKLRQCITKKRKTVFDISKAKPVTKFLELTNLVFTDTGNISKCISAWNNNGISSRIKTFVFKFYNNILGLNTRLSHFVAGQQRGCNFCNGTTVPVPDETFIHLFLECPTTFDWHCSFLKKYLPDFMFLNVQERSELFFLGRLPNRAYDNKFLIMAVLIFQFCIWEEKLRKKIPSFTTLDNTYSELVYSLANTNRKMFQSAELLNLPLCRLTGAQGPQQPTPPAWRPVQIIPRRLPRQP